jgi:hypothetical protein
MSSELPRFAKRKPEQVEAWIRTALTNPRTASTSALRALIAFEDGHFRAIFSPTYFALAEGAAAPSKSQWNTLKKHLKRIEPRLFIFKEHGAVEFQGEACLYLDFGFFESALGDRRRGRSSE